MYTPLAERRDAGHMNSLYGIQSFHETRQIPVRSGEFLKVGFARRGQPGIVVAE
jgi:hypothetical protein